MFEYSESGGLAGSLAAAREQDGQDPELDGQDPVGFLTAAREQVAKLPGQLWRTGGADFAQIVRALDALAVQVQCARVGLVAEALSRGVVDAASAPSGADWLLEHSAHLEPSDAARTVDLARLCAQPKNQAMADAVAAGAVTVRKAMIALRVIAAVEADLGEGKRDEALASLTLMAQSGHERHVVAAGRYLLSMAGADRALEHDEDKLRTPNSLHLSACDDGTTRISGRLDPESGAVLRAALDPLSAPQPADNAGVRDPRPPERRRAEALVEIARRATAAGGSAPATTKAQVLVQITYNDLAGAVRGAGLTLHGAMLSPQTIRKIACDAAIIPMVLGAQSQPLDVGRTKRLVTPALLAAMWARDKGCTYPACTRPPPWCEAHHLKHWIDGGTTALTNMALLCQYHHTWVHQHDLTATTTTVGVTWQTPTTPNPWAATPAHPNTKPAAA